MTAKSGWNVARLTLLGACLALAACGNEPDARGNDAVESALLDALRDRASGSRVLGARNLELSDAQLRTSPTPLIKVTRANIGVAAALSPTDAKGPAIIWLSSDGRALTLFNGLLIATRGLGNDLSSAKVPGVQAGKSDVLREHYYLGGDEVMRRFAYFCDFVDGGRQSLNLLGVTFDTNLVVETCRGDDDSFENKYWFSLQGGILKSMQWASPEIGSLVIESVPRSPALSVRAGADAPVVIVESGE